MQYASTLDRISPMNFSEETNFDVMVIGAGSAGRYGAKVAASLGAKVALIEAGPFGGLCILNGCMPTKTYLRSSELIGLFKKSSEVGIEVEGKIKIAFDRIKARKDLLIKEMAEYAEQGVTDKKNITRLNGFAHFISDHRMQVGKEIYSFDQALIATGSRVSVPPIPGLVNSGFLTSDDVLALESLPKSMIVLGGGAEALEFGQFFNRMGVSTTIIQRSEQVLSGEDPDIGQALADYLRKDGLQLWTGTQIKQIAKQGQKRQVTFTHRGKIESAEAEVILLTTGRIGNIDRLHLEAAGIESKGGNIQVNAYLQTNRNNIYAVGDVNGIDQIVNVATYQGKVAGENMVAGPKILADYRVIPRAIFTEPQYARVGLTEGEAQAQGIAVTVGSFPFEDLGKAIVTDQMEGFIKMLADKKSGEILGVQILGTEASDLIHQAAIAMHYRATLEDYAKISHIHPSFGEIMLYLVEDMIGAI